MKKRKFLAVAVVATMLFSACSDDSTGGAEEINPTGDAWLSLSVNSSTRTRALNTTPQENGTAIETKVNSIRVVLFDGDEKLLGSVDNPGFEGANWGTSGNGVDGKNTTVPFKVPKDTKQLLVILNPSSSLPAAIEGMTYDQYNAAITVSSVTSVIEGETQGTYDNFMMTNASGLLEPQSGSLTLYATEEEAEGEDPFSLSVDRVVAKVRVNTSSVSSIAFTVGSTFNWKLNVTNKKFYPVSERTETEIGTTAWSDPDGLGTYRIDPNYDNTELTYKVGEANTKYNQNYNYFTTEPTWNTDAYEYCLENTQNADGNKHAYTTHIILKAEVVPTTFALPDGSTVETGESGYSKDWFKVGSGYYTAATLVQYIQKELEYKKDNSEYTPALTNLVNTYLGALDATTAVTISDLTDISTIIGNFTTELGKITASNMEGLVSYYHAGISYYKIMVKHDNDTDNTNNLLGEYGVVRNSVYDVTISQINNPGYPVIPEPDPDAEDEEGDYYMSVEININPWTWYTQSEIL